MVLFAIHALIPNESYTKVNRNFVEEVIILSRIRKGLSSVITMYLYVPHFKSNSMHNKHTGVPDYFK